MGDEKATWDLAMYSFCRASITEVQNHSHGFRAFARISPACECKVVAGYTDLLPVGLVGQILSHTSDGFLGRR